jgi:hypothetical protein
MWVGAFGDAPLPYTPGRLNVPPSSTRLGREWVKTEVMSKADYLVYLDVLSKELFGK